MTKKEPGALGAKIVSTGIAVSATLGISTYFTYSAQAKQIDAMLEQVQTSLAAQALVATTPVVAPTLPAAATPVSQNKTKKSQGEPAASTQVDVAVAPTTAAPQLPVTSPIQAPVAAPVPTTVAPNTSSSK
jgi:hypothetical protein